MFFVLPLLGSTEDGQKAVPVEVGAVQEVLNLEETTDFTECLLRRMVGGHSRLGLESFVHWAHTCDVQSAKSECSCWATRP